MRYGARGFTLVELMVALSGGLFMAVVVFALARDGTRFYQRESRIGEATLGAMAGFERLRSDIARAGFLGTPNVQRDPRTCGEPVVDATWPGMLRELASIRMLAATSVPEPLAAQGIQPDSFVLGGSYVTAEQFPIASIVDTGTEYQVYLQTTSGPMARLGWSDTANPKVKMDLVRGVFTPGRGLRIVDNGGGQHYGSITGVNVDARPYVQLSRTPALVFRRTSGSLCGLRGLEVGATVNPISFVRYTLSNNATTSALAMLYPKASQDPYIGTRLDLTRSELSTTGAEIPNTLEVVAEYAVDLQLGLTVVTSTVNQTDPVVAGLAPGHPDIPIWIGPTTGMAFNRGPEFVRAVRVRLSVRSREPDRDSAITPTSTLAPGLHRVGLGQGGTAPFARVRTLQADVALRNQTRVAW
jgi:type II secretory pathway pseudopilin PulG